MPPKRPTARQRRRQLARFIGVTNSIDAFEWVAKKRDRINIIVEGDSWFAYPKEWLIFGPNSNVIDNIFSRLVNKRLVNTLCLPSNGDTALDMLSGVQLKTLTSIFEKRGHLLDLFLFSAGGNDVVGFEDLYPLLNDYQAGYTAIDCLNQNKFSEKVEQIAIHYQKLIDLRNLHAPQMDIVCHTYDFLKPSEVGAVFLWGVKVSNSWIWEALRKRNIPTVYDVEIVKLLLSSLRLRLQDIEANTKKFHVVDTQGTLNIGDERDWLNEIHPTPSGFKRIAKKIYEKIKELQPSLPSW